LFDLIRFGLAAITLNVNAVGDAVFGEDVVTALDSQFEAQMRQ
jgi:hypothetical protein